MTFGQAELGKIIVRLKFFLENHCLLTKKLSNAHLFNPKPEFRLFAGLLNEAQAVLRRVSGA